MCDTAVANICPCFSFPSPVGPYVGRYCGQNTPGRIISYTGILALAINTDSAIAKEGFSANFTVIERTVPEGELARKTLRITQMGDVREAESQVDKEHRYTSGMTEAEM